MMIVSWLGRFFRYCINRVEIEDADCGFDPEYSDYMTDREISDVLHGRGHTIDWNEIRRRRQAGEVKAPWTPRGLLKEIDA